MEIKQLTRIIEGLLFAVDKPISVERLQELFDENERPEKEQILASLEELKNDYQYRAIELKELASGYQFQTRADLAPWVIRLFEERAPKYSRALLETLVLIAYRQPITRGEIEDIRGVAVNSNIIKTLQEREWIRSVGFRDLPGKPELLATTKEFLDYFGLTSLADLPPLADIQDLDKVAEKLEQELCAENSAEEIASENPDQLELDEIVNSNDLDAAETDEAIMEDSIEEDASASEDTADDEIETDLSEESDKTEENKADDAESNEKQNNHDETISTEEVE